MWNILYRIKIYYDDIYLINVLFITVNKELKFLIFRINII